jgi:hypothetical protein
LANSSTIEGINLIPLNNNLKLKNNNMKTKYSIITHKPYAYGNHMQAGARIAKITTLDPDAQCRKIDGCTFWKKWEEGERTGSDATHILATL